MYYGINFKSKHGISNMKFRKKPVVIDAVQFHYTDQGISQLRDFCGPMLGRISKPRYPGALGEAEIGTLEDGSTLIVRHIATEGDWIIKGVQGEFYACKESIFIQTYEPFSE